MRILLVDDDAATRRFCQLVLVKLGYDVDVAADGAEGWTALSSREYQLLITDNDMPRLNGSELIRKVRVSGMTLPVILMSGAFSGMSEDISKLECGAVLPKPFTTAQLLTTVHDLTVG